MRPARSPPWLPLQILPHGPHNCLAHRQELVEDLAHLARVALRVQAAQQRHTVRLIEASHDRRQEGLLDAEHLARHSTDRHDRRDVLTELFLRCRGNLRDVERTLGLSYPTVRARLDALLATLGYTLAVSPDTGEQRREILEALDAGRVTADEAIALLEDRRSS